ncbi:MAG: methyltransferase domain-containing protein [Anaerolineae bacterium]|nr:methyltransferase domain-containing protein [Anaerolineae bacterium]
MDDASRQQKESSMWNAQASGYDARMKSLFADAYSGSVRKAQSVVRPDQHVLEIGCGTGLITLSIAPGVQHVTAIDISPQMIAIAQDKARSQHITNVDFRVADGYALPFDDQAFDTVLVFNILHIVKEPTAVLREAHRLLKPGGLLVSATDCYAEPVPFKAWLLVSLQRLMHIVGSIPFLHYYHKADLNRLLEQSGFQIVETDVLQAVPVNYYVLARKG